VGSFVESPGVSQDLLGGGLASLALSGRPHLYEKLTLYLELLTKWNQVFNLTAIRERDRMVVEHLLDSLAVLGYVRPSRVLDVGSGAGLPGLPFAIAEPSWNVTLLDSNHKKCVFLRQAAIELELPNVEVRCERIESLEPVSTYDTIVSRAFAETQHFARVAAPLLQVNGVLLAMKGLYPQEELAQLPSDVSLKAVEPIRVPGLDAGRHAVVMTRA
jgi:16S rRNA (guanine527-N7)-methyltransferase